MTAQEKNRILRIIAEEIQSSGFLKLSNFGNVLERNGLSRDLYTSTGPKKWLQMNFPEEVEIIGSNGKETLSIIKPLPIPVPIPTPRVELTEDVRQRFIAVLTNQLETYGMLLHSSIPGLLPEWSKYRTSNEKLGAWLARTFREDEFTTRTVNNAAALFFLQTAIDIDRIVQVATEMILPTGIATIAAISAELRRNNLQWESIPIAHNQTLGEWLMDYSTSFSYTDTSETAICFVKDSNPSDAVAITDAIKQAVVYRYVFLPVAGVPLNALREILNDPTYTTAAWKKQSVNVCFDNLMGLGDGFLDDSDNIEPRMAFYTGLQTPEKQHIYCVLVPNDVKTAVQRWRGSIFRYPGQNDPEGYGKWLCQTFGLPSENRDTFSVAYENIASALAEIEGLQTEILQHIEDASKCIQMGDPISNDFCTRLAQYTAHWGTVLKFIQELGISIPTEGSLMAYVKDLLNKKDSVSAVLDAMRADYNAMVTAAWEFMDDHLGALNSDSDPDGDLAQWDQRLAGIHLTEEEIRAVVLELLSPFYAMRTLTRCTPPLNDSEKHAWDIVEKHFNATLRMKDIKAHFMGAEDGTMDFLDRIDEIESRLKLLHIHSDSAVETMVPLQDDRELVCQAMNTVNSIHLIHRHYPALNTFEAAVVCGDHSQVQRIAQEPEQMTAMGYDSAQQEHINREIDKLSRNFSTPVLTAGMNLARLQGNANRQAEKYLLLAISLKDGEAASHLADLYYREGRAELLGLVYDIYGLSFPTEVRRRYLCLLIDQGCIRIPEVIESDILGLLSIQDTATLDGFCRSSQLTETASQGLLRIRQAIEEPFIRQIVFLDSELYRFIQQQENIESIRSLGIQHTQESLGELLRIGNYSRGQDILSTARRIWHFVKDWDGLAETVAALAGESAQKTDILWDIYQFRNDRTQMLHLLHQSPELQAQNLEVYSDLLFTSGAYQEYFDAFSGAEYPTVRMQLQFLVSSIQVGQWDGQFPEDLDSSELANTTDVIILLTALLARNGQIEEFCSFILLYFEPLLFRCGFEISERIVTADGQLEESILLRLQEQAIHSGHSALAIFLFRILGNEDTEHYCESYYSQLWEELRSLDPAGQALGIRKLQLLFPHQYNQRYHQIFPYLLRSKLSTSQDQADEAAETVAQMLTEECIREDNLQEILSILKEASMVCHPFILKKLTMLCQTRGLRDICMHFFHTHRDAFDGKTDHILCRLYRNALENDALPQEYLTEAEPVALRQLQNYQDETAAWCVYAIEEQLGREPYCKFAQLFMRTSEPEDMVTELSLLRQILEDPGWDIGDYLRFCSKFCLFSAQDQENIEDLLRSGQEGALTEAESIPLLHGLYENSQDSRYLAASARLPFRDNPMAYARLLFYGARHSQEDGISWRACVNYCEKFRLDDTLIQVLLEMMQNATRDTGKSLQWYDAKDSFTAVRSLCNRAEEFPQLSNPENVHQLLEEMCTFFIKIDINSSNSINHNSLRTIIELAVASGNENIVTNRLMDKLLGVYTKLGLVFACRLLRRGCYDGALRQFQALSRCYGQIAYKDLIDRLSQMDCVGLEEWTQKESSQMLVSHFILPDGNRPDSQMLKCFVMACITGNKQQVGIEVAEQLITYFANDSICYRILFVLCKDNYMAHLPRIQRALAGLYIHFPVDRRGFYTRNRDNMLTLLTVTSAVMQQQTNPEAIVDIGGFISKNSVMDNRTLNDLVIEQVKQRETILNGFVGLNERQCTLMIHGLMGAVTGNWFVFLDAAYRSDISSLELAEYFKRCQYSFWGLARGILQVYRELDENNRHRFLNWIKTTVSFCNAATGNLKATLNTAVMLISKNDLDTVDRSFLALPWEEHLVCLSDPRDDVGEGKMDSCYMWMMQHLRKLPEGYSANTTLHIFHKIAQDTYRTRRLYIDADQYFRQGEFALAAEIYDLLDTVRAVPKDVRDLTKSEAQRVQMEYKELYQSRSRICRFFLSDENIYEKFRNMKPHSCANIAVVLLQSPYACELARVARSFSESNQRLCQAILKLVNPSISDQEKETVYNAFRNDKVARLVLSQILSTQGKISIGYLFVQDPKFGSMMAAENQMLAHDSSRPYTIIRFTQPVPIQALGQIIELSEESINFHGETFQDADPCKADARSDSFLPAFAMQAYASMQNQELPPLESLREQIDNCGYDNYSHRLYCAQAIYYSVSKENTPDSEQTIAALLKLGQAYRDYHLSRLAPSTNLSDEEKNQLRTLARGALLELACYSNTMIRGHATNMPIIRYAEGLQSILCSDFGSIDEVVSEYKKNLDAYQILLQLITDSEIRNIVTQIFNQIHRLAQHYENGGPKDQNTTSYRIAYKEAYDALEQIPFNLSWNEAKNTLLKHLMRAINDLDKRPYLDVRILNSDFGTHEGALTGLLTNTGRVPAEKISIQVIFGDNSLSDSYGYEELLPNEQICFAVEYTASKESATLSYRLNITYFYREKEFIADPLTGTLELTDIYTLSQDIDLYGAHKELIFTTDEKGNVVSKGFYGRNTEKQDLRKLAPENAEFCDYRTAVIQGFRRTGKTSLLHYFAEHVRSKCADKAVAIYVDCEGFVNQPIQKTFVTSVLFGLENEMPQLSEKESWHRLKNMWMLPDNVTDRDPDTLQFFYQSLGQELDGKGVILIVDEADRLFARVEEIQGAASSLFPSLRAVQHNRNCKKAVCMLLCGSNNMLIYNQDGGKLYQLFEDFTKIKVGRLHKDEIEQLLKEPLAETGEMEYHSEAIEWIWRYTGGLVWYTKLLGNAAVNQAKANSRRIIYPIDVSIAFDSIINEQNCKQYISEGCNDDAKLILDAIATLATRFGTDVTRSQLITLLDGALSENQLDASLKLLTDTLGLLERSVNARNTYHFAVEIYRRFYRTQQSKFQRTEAPADRMSLTALSPATTGTVVPRNTLKKRN